MLFISSTGYLPVTKQAFEQDMAGHMESLDDARIRKMLTAVLSMYENYDLFTAPSFSAFEAISKSYEEDFKTLLTEQRQLGAEALSVQDALTLIQK